MTVRPATEGYGDSMRVAQVCPYSLSVPGGVQQQVLGLARAMRSEGHDVSVLAPCDGVVDVPDVVPLGRSIPVPANGSIARIAPHPAAAWRTRACVRHGAFDVIHVHEPLVPAPSLVALLASRVPVVGTFHRAGVGALYRLLGPPARRAVNRLSVRCVVSEEARETAMSALGGHYELLFNGVDVERFAGAKPWPTEGPTILFLGRHEKRKGLGALVEAFEHLAEGTRLWIAGDGPQNRELREVARGRGDIEWLGRITDDEVASRLRAADVLCAPSLGGESFGVVLLEAMAAGTAVVASDLPGYRTVARHGREALLVPPGDHAALAEALASVLGDRALREQLVTEGARRAREYSMARLASRYLALYEDLPGS